MEDSIRGRIMNDLDPDWPGNWEGEEEPRTEEVPGSMDAVTLFNRIDTAPERLKFQQYLPLVFMYLLIAFLSLVAGLLVLLFLEPLPSLLFFFLSLLFIFIVNYDGNSHRTVTSSLGIGGRPPFSYDTAIEWEHIEHIDVIPSKESPSEFVFRGNGRYLWHDNHSLGKKMTLEIINSYIPGFENWTTRQKIGWSEGVLVFSRPGSEKIYPIDEKGRRQFDEFDDERGYLSSKEVAGSLSSEELLVEIKKDPELVKYGRWGNAGSVFLISILFTFTALAVLYFLVEVNGFIAMLPVFIAMGVIWVLLSYWLVREVRKHGFFLSPTGIGVVEAFLEPRAIRWDHVEWIDVWIRDGRLHMLSVVGNLREIKIHNSFFHRRFEIEEMQRYLPGYESWQTYRSDDWFEGITRYRRTPRE